MRGVRSVRAALLASILALAGCATVNDAPVVDLSTGADPGAPSRIAPRDDLPVVRAAAPGEHVVAAGDTLYGIAFRHGLDYRSLADWNRIPPPFTIRPGQVLTLRAPPVALAAAPPPSRDADAVPAQVELPGDTVVLAAPDPGDAVPPGEVRTFGIDGEEPVTAIAVEPAAVAGDGREAAPAVPPPPPRPIIAAQPSLPAEARGEPLRPAPDGAMPPPLPRPGATGTATTAPPVAAGPATPAARPAGALARVVADPAPVRPSPAPAAPEPPEPAVAAAPPASPTPEPVARIADGPSRAAGGVRWRWPADGTLVNRFAAGDPARQGIDVRGRAGAPVVAAADGEVVYSGNGLVGYGELIIIKHSAEFLSAYGHNRRRLVAEGQRVKAGQAIAEMGRAPNGFDALHFEIRRAGRPTDPLQFLPPR